MTVRELFNQHKRGELSTSELHERIALALNPLYTKVTTPDSMKSQIKVMEGLNKNEKQKN